MAIEEGISYEAAKNSNEFELAKIAMIILIHGVNEHNEFAVAADKLDENHHSMTTNFYNLCSREIKIPPKEVRIYDEFLNSTSNSRRSISKGSIDAKYRWLDFVDSMQLVFKLWRRLQWW